MSDLSPESRARMEKTYEAECERRREAVGRMGDRWVANMPDRLDWERCWAAAHVGAEERQREADEAMKAILDAESGAGRLSGSRGIAECAVDQAVVYLHRRGLLTDEKRGELERRGSLGDQARAVLAVSSTENESGR